MRNSEVSGESVRFAVGRGPREVDDVEELLGLVVEPVIVGVAKELRDELEEELLKLEPEDDVTVELCAETQAARASREHDHRAEGHGRRILRGFLLRRAVGGELERN